MIYHLPSKSNIYNLRSTTCTLRILFLSLLISCFLLLTSSAVQAAPPSNATDWELTFSDDFNGTSLDRSKWNTLYRYGTPIVNDEKQAYVDSALVFDPQVPGSLRIKATKNAALYNNDADSMPYSSGLITTESLFSQKYGYFEIRCRMPAGQGYWPAFWMRGAVPEEDGVEIDIHEFNGATPQRLYFTNHYEDSSHTTTYNSPASPNLTQDYYTIGVDWTESALKFYVNDVLQSTHTQDVPQVAMYLLANLAVGGSWFGDPNASTPFPGYYDIDYIKAYRRIGGVVATPQISPINRIFSTSPTITLSTSTPGASVYYTLDGSEPTQASNLYQSPFTLNQSATLKAKAFKSGLTPSPTQTASFYLISPTQNIFAPLTQTDIGRLTGTGTFKYGGNGQYLIGGGGHLAIDWGKPNDSFSYVYVPLQGDGSITARVVAIDPVNPYAVAGVSIRGSLTPDAQHASVMVMAPLGNTVRSIWRTYSGNGNVNSDPYDHMGYQTPIYLRLVRSGDNFTAFHSSNGTTWATLGEANYVDMPTQAYIGLVVSSHYNDKVATALIDNLSITGGVPAITPPPTSPTTHPWDLTGDTLTDYRDFLHLLTRFNQNYNLLQFNQLIKYIFKS